MSQGKGISSAKSGTEKNPCVQCGACCAYFRVMFYWREIEPDSEYQVPVELSEDLDQFRRGMKGTSEKQGNQCIALTGRIGTRATCSIYSNRPSPCRAFQASYSNGKQNKRCDEARMAHGLKPLRPQDWDTQPKTDLPSIPYNP